MYIGVSVHAEEAEEAEEAERLGKHRM